MNKKLTAIFASLIICLSILATTRLATAANVFLDDFSSGNFAGWSKTYVSAGSSQTVTDGTARFIVPTPTGGNVTYSYLQKDGYTATPNSTIIATQDIYVTKVPNGYPQGNGAIFFLYLCDSTDLSGGNGNFGVGIDGSDVWSLWIGGTTNYTYVFQTAGASPASNTWYHLVLTIDNPHGTTSLTVNGVEVINVAQQQFTDKPHQLSLMSGMGEDWWCEGNGQQEIDVDNVTLYISAAPAPTDNPNPPTHVSDPTSMPDVSEFQSGTIIALLIVAVAATAVLYRKKSAKKGKPAAALQNLPDSG
jgi:hypothetical protein